MSIEVKNITKLYKDQKALNDVSFKINDAEIVGFLGPNGAGKSTMMKILTTYVEASKGSASVNGFNVNSNKKNVQRSVGYLPEHNPLYTDLYVKEYLSFNANVYNTPKARINEVIELTGLQPEALKKISAETGMEYVIIRPPLVYGPCVKANFLSMLKWVSRGVPLPLGGIKGNKRSLVFVDNLVDLIKTCIEHPAAANQTFLVSDDDDVSTRELLVRVATALGVKSRLLNIPPDWLGLAGKLLGKKGIEQRLCASLQVNIAHTKNTLNWTPPYSMEEGLKQTSDWYKTRS